MFLFSYFHAQENFTARQEIDSNMGEDVGLRWLAVSKLPLGSSEVCLREVIYLFANDGLF